MTSIAVERIRTRVYDFTKGIVGGISDFRGRIAHVRRATNLIFRPARAMKVRNGSQAISAPLPELPIRLAKFFGTIANKLFAATDSGGGAGKLFRVTETSVTQQALPFTPTNNQWSFTNLNATLIGTQVGGTQKPIFFSDGLSATPDTWASTVLVAPAAATVAVGAAGNVDAGVHFYRTRYVYRNGISVATNAAASVNPGVASIINVTFTAGSGQEYLGISIERTKANASGGINDIWYVVVTNYTGSSPYPDNTSDASLLEVADEGIAAAPPHFEGIVGFKNRLIGWYGSALQVSQLPGDENGSGIFNFDPELTLYATKDDGDSIVTCVPQADRLLIFKHRRILALEGDDPDSFRLVDVYNGIGAINPRAVVSFGSTVFCFSGQSGMFIVEGNQVSPFGWVEVGHYKDLMDSGHYDDCALFNYLGEFLIMKYRATGSSYAQDQLVYDIRFRNWTHFEGWRIADAYIQKGEADFSSATMLFADQAAVGGDTTNTALNPSWIVWRDQRSGTDQVFLQQLAYTGATVFTTNGIPVSANAVAGADNYMTERVRSHPTDGGCYVGWTAKTPGPSNEAWVQRYDADGSTQWPTPGGTGVRLTTTVSEETAIRIAVDDDGACFVMWDSQGAGARHLIQKLSGAGTVLWTAGGVTVSSEAPLSYANGPIKDGAGGCFVPFYGASTVNVRRLDSGGATLWTSTTTSVANWLGATSRRQAIVGDDGHLWIVYEVGSTQVFAKKINASTGATIATSANLSGGTAWTAGLAVAPSGGAYVSWIDSANGVAIYCTRLTASATKVWASDVILKSSLVGHANSDVSLVPDGVGGVIVAWDDMTAAGGTQTLSYAQRLDSNGVKLWGSGTPITVSGALAGNHSEPTVCTDGARGVIVGWVKDGVDIRSQRILENGVTAWADGGVSVCAASGTQTDPTNAFTNAAPSEIPSTNAYGYRIWSAFVGNKDAIGQTGVGGNAIPVLFETPFNDDGSPDLLKDYGRISIAVDAPTVSLAGTLSADDTGELAPFSLEAGTTNLTWAATGPPYWGTSGLLWSGASRLTAETGLRAGTLGRRYSLAIRGDVTSEMTIWGYTVDAAVLPERRF